MQPTFLLADSDWYNLLREDATSSCRVTALVTLYCIFILVLARYCQILCTDLRTDGLHRSIHAAVHSICQSSVLSTELRLVSLFKISLKFQLKVGNDGN